MAGSYSSVVMGLRRKVLAGLYIAISYYNVFRNQGSLPMVDRLDLGFSLCYPVYIHSLTKMMK